MRLTPLFLTFALSTALLTTTSYVFADNHEAGEEQHEPLDDAALEEEYGIKAGSVKRDEETSSDADQSNDQARIREEEEEEEKNEEENSENANSGEESSGAEETREGEDDVALEPGKSEDRNPEAGTGGTGSPDDAIHSSEEENGDNDDNDGTDDNE
ncbi:hypothetical protein [Vreelandella neptunia]|uniref:Uncharacterized protein n=1 Tax=Vreelandella neptunia TaxID=115551 RepID=A0ABS9SD10_9GAMM|nr:hypothetical protein [Halomonas neptunia]MCH4813997.1 hypothetical protein [Halomonas neptunia]